MTVEGRDERGWWRREGVKDWSEGASRRKGENVRGERGEKIDECF